MMPSVVPVPVVVMPVFHDEPEDPEVAPTKNEVHEEQAIRNKKDEKKCCSKKCWIILIFLAVFVVIIGVVLGIVFGVVYKKDDNETNAKSGPKSESKSGLGPPYKVEIERSATAYNGTTYDFLENFTDVIVRNGGAAWDDNNEFLVKLEIQGNNAIVKSEVHHMCCAHEMEAGGNTLVDSGSWGDWGDMKSCQCDQSFYYVWYDHEIRARVTKVDSAGTGYQPGDDIDNEPTPTYYVSEESEPTPTYFGTGYQR